MYNLENIATQLGFGINDVKAIITVLVEEAEISLNKIKEMFKRDAWEQIGIEAHSIKGSAGNMQLTHLSELSAALEIAAKAQEKQKVEALINAVQDTLKQLHQAL